jgi:tRNA modification GTPase
MIQFRSSSLAVILLWLMRFSSLISRGKCSFATTTRAHSSCRNTHGVAFLKGRRQNTRTSRDLGPALVSSFPNYRPQQEAFPPNRSLSQSLSVTSTRLQSTSSQQQHQDPSYDTIFALSSGFTGQQATAVAILRISGPKAHEILDTLTKTPLPAPRKAALKKLWYKDKMLDHALVLLFQQPHSFTGEDLVELHCHGSRAVVQGLLELLPTLGLRMAEPGEFTQRAFGNGKLDLVQVEALADILAADTQSQLQQALSQLDGKLSQVYEEWRTQLISGLAHAEAVIDFGDDERLGEDDILDDDSAQWDVWGSVGERMLSLQGSMKLHLQDERKGELVREGVRIAIVGPPNAGKSSLFNLLARKDAAIVSPIAGTTRDVLQVSLDLGGVKCTLQDTAGVRRETSDSLEMEGMKRANSVAKQADLIVAMVDGTEASKGMDIVNSVLDANGLKAEHVMLVLNKLDLLLMLNDDDSTTATAAAGALPKESQSFGGTFQVSCETQAGIDSLLTALTKTVVERTQSDGQDQGQEGALITRARHRQHVEAAAEALGRFCILSQQGTMAVDMAAEELRLAASELGRITGAVDVEDVLDVLFTDFCIGK